MKKFLIFTLAFVQGYIVSFAQDYKVAFDKNAMIENRTEGTVTKIEIEGNISKKTSFEINADEQKHAYLDKTPIELRATTGEDVKITLSYSAETSLTAYLYIDTNQNGGFTNILHSGKTGERFPATGFTITDDIKPGMYRARLKLDKEGSTPAIKLSDDLMDGDMPKDGVIIDFLMNICAPEMMIDVDCMHGNIVDKDGNALALNNQTYKMLRLKTVPVCDGYTRDSVTIRHGHNIYGPQYVRGNRQWNEYKILAKTQPFTVPADSVNGDILVSCEYKKTNKAKWIIEFQEEFNQEDGTQPDATWWERCPQSNAAWARYCSTSKDVVFIRDNKLVCRTIPNPDKRLDDRTMLSGGIQTKNKFWFQYGKVECRAMTNPWVGNFPAIWMMPQDTSRGGWPYSGEIDIFETIDDSNRSWHTVHSEWTYVLGKTWDPQSSQNVECNQSMYHVFGIEWDAEKIQWFVDGNLVFTYNKSTNESALEQGQWPFDRTFYLILNQSVGNGSWAKNRDAEHTYEMVYDWIRVYKKAEESGIEDIKINRQESTVNNCYNLAGQKVDDSYKGIVISNGKKYIR